MKASLGRLSVFLHYLVYDSPKLVAPEFRNRFVIVSDTLIIIGGLSEPCDFPLQPTRHDLSLQAIRHIRKFPFRTRGIFFTYRLRPLKTHAHILTSGCPDWCGIGESNSCSQFGKLMFYH